MYIIYMIGFIVLSVYIYIYIYTLSNVICIYKSVSNVGAYN